MLSALKISQKLALLIVVAVLAFVISQGFVINTERSNSSRLAEVEERLYPTLELSTINLGQLALIELQINSAVATGDDSQLEATQAYYRTIRDNLTRLAELNPELRQRIQQLSQNTDTYYRTATRIANSFIDGSADFARIGEEASANARRLEQVRSAMTEMQADTRTRFTLSISDTVEASRDAGTLAMIILVVATVLLVGLSFVIGRSITQSLSQIIRSLEDMATGEGDLTSRLSYQGRDELRQLVDNFNLFVEKLHKSFHTISEDVVSLNQVAQQLSGASNQNLERIQDQSEALAAARHAVDELMKSVEEVAGFASSASDQTQDAARFAQQGQSTVNSNIAMIQKLATEVEETATVVNRFEEFSIKVGGLLDTIQNVAEQTNLLALNAAIEAARAGEHGRGFAVVADEVRGLAVRTRSATEEIHSVISELGSLSGSAVAAMQQSVSKARDGVKATTESGEMLQKILENVQAISSINEQIAAATYEQSTTFNDVNSHINDIYQNAEKVTESTRNLDQISRDIESVSRGLNEVSSQFKA